MKKLLLLLFFASGAMAQEMTKDQALAYIKTVYSDINKIYVSGNTYKTYPQTVDNVKLEYDQLVIAVTIKENDGTEIKKTLRANISGTIKINSDKESLINDSGDTFLHVHSGNTAQLERLMNAVIYLQKFIVKDPFAK